MVQVPEALSPEPYKSPIAKPLSAEQKDAIQPTGPVQTRSPVMPIPDPAPLRVGTIDQPQDFVTLKARRSAILGTEAVQSPADYTRENDLRFRIATALNSVSAENGSDTPDFILAEYLITCLQAFDNAVNVRDRWYGRGVQAQETVPPPTDPTMNQASPTDEMIHSDAELPATPVGRDRLA